MKLNNNNDSYRLDNKIVKDKEFKCQGWYLLQVKDFRRKKKPRSVNERGSPENRKPYYRLPLLDAFSGLILAFLASESLVICEAMLQSPVFHFNAGSGQAEQYQPAENSALRLQPLHSFTISWQIPPL
jgi:hypothetical protein